MSLTDNYLNLSKVIFELLNERLKKISDNFRNTKRHWIIPKCIEFMQEFNKLVCITIMNNVMDYVNDKTPIFTSQMAKRLLLIFNNFTYLDCNSTIFSEIKNPVTNLGKKYINILQNISKCDHTCHDQYILEITKLVLTSWNKYSNYNNKKDFLSKINAATSFGECCLLFTYFYNSKQERPQIPKINPNVFNYVVSDNSSDDISTPSLIKFHNNDIFSYLKAHKGSADTVKFIKDFANRKIPISEDIKCILKKLPELEDEKLHTMLLDAIKIQAKHWYNHAQAIKKAASIITIYYSNDVGTVSSDVPEVTNVSGIPEVGADGGGAPEFGDFDDIG